jgi:subtilisin family serine protease
MTGRGNWLLLLTLLALAAIAGTPAAAQRESDVPSGPAKPSGDGESRASSDASRLLDKAREEGSVRVIVRLQADFAPEGRLSGAQRADQRDAIDSAQAKLKADLRGTGSEILREYQTIPYVALELSPKALEAARRSPLVNRIEEDRPVPATLADSGPLVRAPETWASGHTGSGKVVAVLDTGVDASHSFLSGKVVEEACYSGNSNCPNGTTTQTGAGAGGACTYASSGCQHGTHVAGIAAGRGTTFSGVGKDASAMAVQVFSRFTGSNCTGAGEDPCTKSFTSDQIAGLERVYALRSTRSFSSVNMSLGGGRFFSNCDTASQKAIIDNLRSADIATVIASGNNGFTDSISSPACISSAVSVGSTTKTDTISSFSNSSPLVSLLAPGSSINSSVPGGGFAAFNGTSMAAPHVAGAWALLKQQSPSASVAGILTALQATGRAVADTRVTGGVIKPRIDVAAAAGLGSAVGNDSFASAQLLSGASATVTGTNLAATKETGEPNHAGNSGGKSVWYRWTPEGSGNATITTAGSSFDTLLGVYTGSAVNGLAPVASNDDSGGVVQSRVELPVTAGTTYWVAVDGYNGASGSVTLNLSSDTTPPPDNEDPTVALTAPASGGVIRGMDVALSADATDNVGVDRVEFLVDGQVVGTDPTPTGNSYSVSLNSLALTDGRSTIAARAYDGADNDSTTSNRQVILDNTYPNTQITAGPAEGSRTRSRSAAFRFSSSERDSTFRCKLDDGPVENCSPGKSYSNLSSRRHTFKVYAVGAAGEAEDSDATPASRTWTVDSVAPRGAVAINGRAATTKSRRVRLHLTATDNTGGTGVARMRVSHNGTSWSRWVSFASRYSWTLSGRSGGRKKVYVQYVDRVGNVSARVSDTITYAP